MDRARGILRNVIDPTRIEYGVASSVVVGAVSLVDPARLTFGQRMAFRCLTAAVTGALVLIELRRVESFESPVAKAGVAVGFAGTVLGLSEVSEKLDARIIGGLRRAGIRRPRLLVAVASTLTSFAAFRSGGPGEALDEDRAFIDFDADVGRRYAELDPTLRALVDGMLEQTTGYSAETLRQQWTSARAICAPDETDGIGTPMEVSVDEATPRAVPYDFTFPVKARFRTPSGVLAQVAVGISHGRLRPVWIEMAEGEDESESFDFDEEDFLEGLNEWPTVEQVEFVLDTP